MPAMDALHQNSTHLSTQLLMKLNPHSRKSKLHDQINSIQCQKIARNYSSSNIPSMLQSISISFPLSPLAIQLLK